MDSETFHKIEKFKIQIDLKVKNGKYSHYVLEQFDAIAELFGLSENLLIDDANEQYYDELSIYLINSLVKEVFKSRKM